MIQLSDFFSRDEVLRDAAVWGTMYPRSLRVDSVCYALAAETLAVANANPHIVAIITTFELAAEASVEKGVVVHESP
ncbi:MAG: hypothetical protein QOD99_1762, partial [Chthoniobacter sp.]|nr:hypothetical protein [Chthoniobacter sp.]